MSDLIRKLEQAALPDSHDEREVLHAPLIREAAEKITKLEAELAECKENAIKTVRDTFESDAIEAWKKENQLLCEREEAAERLCSIYFKIAADEIGESAVREKLQQALEGSDG